MSNENINSTVGNLCRGPVAGSWCSIDTSSASYPILHIRNESGGLLGIYSILGGVDPKNLKSFEYVGPLNTTSIASGFEFMTLENISPTRSIVKIWELDDTFKTLNLVDEHTFNNHYLYSFNLKAMAVEYYHVTLTEDCDRGISYIYLDDVSKITYGMRLVIGPSSDNEYSNTCERVTVRSVSLTDHKVYINSLTVNQYARGNQVSFYKYVYLISTDGIEGDPSRGMMIRVNPIDWGIIDFNTKAIYKKLTLAKWCPYFHCIAMLYSCNILYCDPYNYYINYKSQFLNNFRDSKVDFYTIFDIAFNDNVVYKLSKEASFRQTDGTYYTVIWSNYNFQKDNLIPYVSNVSLFADDSYTIAPYDEISLRACARDQFNIGLRDVVVNVKRVGGDSSGLLTPLDGVLTTNISGTASIKYKSGVASYTGATTISIDTIAGSAFYGTTKVANSMRIFSECRADTAYAGIESISKTFTSTSPSFLKQLFWVYTESYIPAYSYFSSIGGNWKPKGDRNRFDLFPYWVDIATDQGINNHSDMYGMGGVEGMGLTLNDWSYTYDVDNPGRTASSEYCIANRLTQLSSFEISERIRALRDFLIYPAIGVALPPFLLIPQLWESYKLYIDQLYHSRHSFWLDGVYVARITSDINLNQFIFVQDARPAFWSRKNTIETNIWLRLRPFASNLDPTTIVMKVRSESWKGDTGYVDVSDLITTQTFDAGAGLLGVEVTYDPSENFINNAVIYVYLSIRDVLGNLIIIRYWFTTIHDYRTPYLYNLTPGMGETGVLTYSKIYFEIKDDNTGVDIDTLDMSVDSKVVFPQVVEKINDNHYVVEYTPNTSLMHGKEVVVAVHVADLAEQPNWLHISYKFYIAYSDSVMLTNFLPEQCVSGVDRFSDVSFVALDGGDGVDPLKLRLQINGEDVTHNEWTNILPIIYRVL